jgi:hypothetical protein
MLVVGVASPSERRCLMLPTIQHVEHHESWNGTYFVASLHTGDDALNISTHKCERRGCVHIHQGNFRGFAVQHRNQTAAYLCNEPEREVHVLAGGDLHGPLANPFMIYDLANLLTAMPTKTRMYAPINP